jgi:L-gulono-1,4-lactone dehydrogenase
MWSNWAGSHHCAPVRHLRPVDRAQVRAAVASAERVRVAGSGHSFTAAALTDDTLLSLDRLDRVLDADPAGGLVRVEAGITLAALSAALDARGLALPNLGDIDAQTLGGALATATHGTGLRHPNLSAQVEAVELVLAGGEERTLTRADGDLLRAARVGLGTLGVVVAVTLRCVPAFALHGLDRPEPLEDVLADLQERAERHDHFEFWTFPHSPLALTRTNTPTDAPPSPPGRAREWIGEVLVDNAAFEAVCRIGRRFPGTIPALNRFASRTATQRERVDRSHRVFASPRLVRFTEMEYALPRARAEDAVRVVKEILERHPVSFPLELRFAAADDALLSPAYERDSAYVAVHAYVGMPWEAPFREVEAVLAGWGGRPHWGKRSFLGRSELAPRHPGWDAWQAARAELDPDGVFTNRWAERVLGPVVRPRDATAAVGREPPRGDAPAGAR